MNTLAHIDQWFAAAIPNPTDKNRAVQLGCHFEEVGEMAEAARLRSVASDLYVAATVLKQHAQVSPHYVDRQELLDALADQIVTAIGVAHCFNMDLIGALAEVDRSNWSKFVDGKPVFNEHGKIAKGPDYFKPDLVKFVE